MCRFLISDHVLGPVPGARDRWNAYRCLCFAKTFFKSAGTCRPIGAVKESTLPKLPPSSRVLRSLLATALVVPLSCESADKSTRESPPGSYRATAFTSTADGVSTDHLANGSTITLVLSPQGMTSGHLHFVAAAGSPGMDEDMSGTWAMSGSTIDLTQSADTFMRDLPLEFTGNTLVGEREFSGTRIHVTLTRD